MFLFSFRNNFIDFNAIYKANKEAAENESTASQQCQRRTRKRTSVNYKKADEWHVSGMSASGSDFETDGTEDEFAPNMPRSHRQSVRGILAYQGTTRQRGALVHTQKSPIAGTSSALVGVSSRGQMSGRRRQRISGFNRGRSRGRGYARRIEMLDDHRRIVETLREDDTTEMPNVESSILPALNEGTFMNDFCYE